MATSKTSRTINGITIEAGPRGERTISPLIIDSMQRLPSSPSGNPNYQVVFRAPDGSRFKARTSSNISWAYEATNPEFHGGAPLRVTFTRAGRIATVEAIAPREESPQSEQTDDDDWGMTMLVIDFAPQVAAR